MKGFWMLACLVGVGAFAWRIGGAMSPDAVSMAVGVVFGVLASIPAALLVTLVGRREAGGARRQGGTVFVPRGVERAEAGYPPVVVVGPPALPDQSGASGVPVPGWPGGWQNYSDYDVTGGPRGRQFTVVGEEDAFLDGF